MKPSTIPHSRGFTLLETVIAIGVLAVLLTGFIVVFTPATDGIRKSINTEQADRLASALEQELVNVRPGQTSTAITNGFSKAFEWIKGSNTNTSNATAAVLGTSVLVYHYRGKIATVRSDGTPTPETALTAKSPGKDYVVVPAVRRLAGTDRTNFIADLPAVEGSVYLVKCTQLIFNGTNLIKGTAGTIADPKTGATITSADLYPASTLSFNAEFHIMPTKTSTYYTTLATIQSAYNNAKNPIFSRNLSIRR